MQGSTVTERHADGPRWSKMVMTAMTFCMRDVQYVEWEVYLITPYSIFIHVKLNFALFFTSLHMHTSKLKHRQLQRASSN